MLYPYAVGCVGGRMGGEGFLGEVVEWEGPQRVSLQKEEGGRERKNSGRS